MNRRGVHKNICSLYTIQRRNLQAPTYNTNDYHHNNSPWNSQAQARSFQLHARKV